MNLLQDLVDVDGVGLLPPGRVLAEGLGDVPVRIGDVPVRIRGVRGVSLTSG